jgi:catechol 2,3-dioxygenase-like lactoylglutathione lyase family enzyme
MAWKLGPVGHFGLAVRDYKKSAKWWVDNVGVELQFEFDGGIAVGTDAITIVLSEGVPHPGTMGHMSFHIENMTALREALADLKAKGVKVEDPGDEIGPEAAGSTNMGLWFHDLDGYRWELNVQNGARKQ